MPRPTLDKLPYGFKVPALLKAVPPARRRVRAVAQGLGLALDDDVLASIELLAGEVIANAVRHTKGSCAVCLRWTGTRLRVEVTDIDTAVTKLLARVATPEDENGRGLLLVEAMADAWGTVPEPAGKTTWFEISAELIDRPESRVATGETSADRGQATCGTVPQPAAPCPAA